MKLLKRLLKKSSNLNKCIVCNKKIKSTSSNQLFCGNEDCDEHNYTVIDDMHNI